MAEKEHAQEVWTIVPVSAFLILVITMNYSPDYIVLLDLVCLISRQKIKTITIHKPLSSWENHL